MKKLLIAVISLCLGCLLLLPAVANAAITPVAKTPTIVYFRVTPNHVLSTGGIVRVTAKVKRATTCTFSGDGVLTMQCKGGSAEANVTVAPNRLAKLKIFTLSFVARNGYGAAHKRSVLLTEAAALLPPPTTVPPTTVPVPTSTQPVTQCTGPCKFTFPTSDYGGILSIQLMAITQGVPCPDDNPFGGCNAVAGQQIDDVNLSVCAGSEGATDIGFGVPDDLSLDLNNATQASQDDVTDDSSVPTAFGNYAILAPGQCVTGDIFYDVTEGAQWQSLNYSYQSGITQTVYVWNS